MKTFESYDLIQIGLYIRYLMSLNDSIEAKHVKVAFIQLKKRLEIAGLEVSISAFDHINEFAEVKEEIKKLDDDIKLSDELCQKMKKQVYAFEQVIFAESRIKKIYVVSERRYNGEYLLSQPEKLLKDRLFGKLSDTAKFDFASACRCLSFGEATACAFHILRATEDTLKNYYFKYKKTNRLAKPMWVPMTSELRNKNGKKPSETILSSLDLVRTSYRNPTQHPEAIYDIDSTQDLFGVCIDLINKMAQEFD